MPTCPRCGQTCTPEQILTPRERDVLRLLGQGLRTRVIAERLYISMKTLHTHIEHLEQKLDLPPSLAAVIAYAARQSVVAPPMGRARARR